MLENRFVFLAVCIVIFSIIQTLVDKKTGFQPSDSIVAQLAHDVCEQVAGAAWLYILIYWFGLKVIR